MACGGDGGTTAPPPPGDGPDTTPPQSVSSLTASFDSTSNALVLRWLAPRDDRVHRRVDRYEIRYTRTFPFDWVSATPADDPPAPLDPGLLQQFIIARPARPIDFYAAVRARDEAGNLSPIGNIAHVHVPGFSVTVTCIDVVSGVPVAGLDAAIDAGAGLGHDFVTDINGSVTVPGQPSGTLGVTLRTGSAAARYHVFQSSFVVDSDTTLSIAMIPFQQPNSSLYPSILALLRDGLFSPGGTHTIRRWHNYPVQIYARDFTNSNGLDYRALLQQAADRWNTRLGFQMFTATGADPATGILVEFLPRSTMGPVNGVTDYSLDADGYPIHDHIRIVDDFLDGPRPYEVFLHELGHTIPLLHLPQGFIMFGSQPLPHDISDDEVTMVRLLVGLPNGTVLDNYDQAPPTR